MNVKLTKHLSTKEDKQRFTERLLHNQDLLDIFKNILLDELNQSYQRQSELESYQYGGAWPYFQADCAGEQRTLRRIIDILTVAPKQQ